MKRFFLFACILFCTSTAFSQIVLPAYPDSIFPTYYHQRWTLFKSLPTSKKDIIFLGNSITDGGEWTELLGNKHCKNRGISGDVTAGVMHRLADVTQGRPAKIFLLIGVNDLSRNTPADTVLKNILLIADYVRQESPRTKLYVQSLLPVNASLKKFGTHTNKGEVIRNLNARLAAEASAHRYTFVNLYPAFADDNQLMRTAYTNDGLHLLGAAYVAWAKLLQPYLR